MSVEESSVSNGVSNFSRKTCSTNFPTVSVIVPTKNRPERLKEAVESIISQDYGNFEIVVVNDGGCPVDDLLLSFGLGPKLVQKNLSESRGPAYARNVAVESATGTIITYLDDDDVYKSNHFSTIVKSITNPDAPLFVYTNVEHVTFAMSNGIWSEKSTSKGDVGPFDYQRLLVKNFIPLICIGHTKDQFVKQGKFNTSLPFLEDWEMLLRLTKGCGGAFIDAPTAVYRHYQDDETHVNDLSEDSLRITKQIYSLHHIAPNSSLSKKRNMHLANLANALRIKRRQELSPPFDAQMGTVKSHLGTGRLDLAISSLETLIQSIPNDGELLVLLSKLHRACGNTSISDNLFESAEINDPLFFLENA